jgi:hypothetical protein
MPLRKTCYICGQHPKKRVKDPWGKWRRVSDLHPAGDGRWVCSQCIAAIVRSTVALAFGREKEVEVMT